SKGEVVRHRRLAPAGEIETSGMPESGLEKHLAAVAATPPPGEDAGIVLQHVQVPAGRNRRPALDAVSILVPQRPVEVEVRAGGQVKRYRLRKGDVALSPPFFDGEAKIGAFEGVMGFVRSPVLAAAAAALDPDVNGPIV